MLVLRPSLRIYRTPAGVVLFDRDPYGIEERYMLRPAAAFVLALFDGVRGVDDVVSVVSRIFDADRATAASRVGKMIETYGGRLLVDSNEADQRWVTLKPPVDDLRSLLYKTEDDPPRVNRPTSPYSVVHILTKRCQRECVYCYADGSQDVGKEDWLKLTRLEALLKEMGELGVATVNYSGGEPFCRPEIVEIAIATLEQGIFPWISTKARVHKHVAQRLGRAGLPLIQVSVDSLSSGVQDSLCNSEGALSDMRATIDAFLSAGVSVCTNTVVTAANIEEIPSLVDSLITYGIRTCILSPYARSLGRHADALFATDVQWARLFAWYAADCDKTRVRLRYTLGVQRALELPLGRGATEGNEQDWARSACTAGREGFAVLPDGRATLCERLAYHPNPPVVGNLRDEGVAEVWVSDRMLRMALPKRDLYKGTACSTCMEYGSCTARGGRCFVRAWLAYRRLFAPDPFCPRAPLVQERLI